jgi:hypothetical protein
MIDIYKYICHHRIKGALGISADTFRILKEIALFVRLIQWFRSTTTLKATVTDRTRSDDGMSCSVDFKEIGGRERTFTHTYDWADADGVSLPKPRKGDTVILHVNRRGEIIYSGSAH